MRGYRHTESDAFAARIEKVRKTWNAHDCAFLDMGHRFWLRLTDDEFDAVAEHEMAIEIDIAAERFSRPMTESEREKVLHEVRQEIISVFCHIYLKWGDNRKTMAERIARRYAQSLEAA